MKKLDLLAVVLLIVGGLNWGLVAIARFDLVAAVSGLDFGETNALPGSSTAWSACPRCTSPRSFAPSPGAGRPARPPPTVMAPTDPPWRRPASPKKEATPCDHPATRTPIVTAAVLGTLALAAVQQCTEHVARTPRPARRPARLRHGRRPVRTRLRRRTGQRPGSLAVIANQPVATAASQNPALSTLVTAVTKAGLADTLNSAAGHHRCSRRPTTRSRRFRRTPSRRSSPTSRR